MAEYIEREAVLIAFNPLFDDKTCPIHIAAEIEQIVDQAPRRRRSPGGEGRWILEAHNERVNYRWNVTAECSECCDERKEIWAGFFPGVLDSIARGAAIVSAESVKLSNFCPNCGADMREG